MVKSNGRHGCTVCCDPCSLRSEIYCEFHLNRAVEGTKARRAERKKAGICRVCPAQTKVGSLQCDAHIKLENEKNKAQERKNREKGLCRCGKSRDGDYKVCSYCREANRKAKFNVKYMTLLQYSKDKNKPVCECCKTDILEFLTIDHINKDGALHRKKVGGAGNSIYRDLRKNNFPLGYRVLCWNCNLGSYINRNRGDLCPHSDMAEDLYSGLTDKALAKLREKHKILDKYGAKCFCCGELDKRLLCIDHINGDGRKMGEHQNLYQKIKKKGYPDGMYQTACYNCNMGRQLNKGSCPHGKI